MVVSIERVYQGGADDGEYRVLVDRLWPRGVSKQVARLDEWMKDVAPSPELRKWFNHDPARFDEFRKRYLAELDVNDAVDALRALAESRQGLILLYGARDPLVNHAVVLRDYLDTLVVPAVLDVD